MLHFCFCYYDTIQEFLYYVTTASYATTNFVAGAAYSVAIYVDTETAVHAAAYAVTAAYTVAAAAIYTVVMLMFTLTYCCLCCCL